jgi:hypothetical protein
MSEPTEEGEGTGSRTEGQPENEAPEVTPDAGGPVVPPVYSSHLAPPVQVNFSAEPQVTDACFMDESWTLPLADSGAPLLRLADQAKVGERHPDALALALLVVLSPYYHHRSEPEKAGRQPRPLTLV